jgi:hypothetical protein
VENSRQTTSAQLFRISGFGLCAGAVAFILHVVLRSVVTAGVDPTLFAKDSLWAPVNALGVVGAALVLLALPALYAWLAGPTGWPGLTGVVLLALAWMFFGLFLSLYSLLVLPWLAEHAPSLVAAAAPLPVGFLIAFICAMVAWLAGAPLLAIPFLRGRVQPRWVGYVLLASALWVVIGNIILAPAGPAANLAVNLLSNLAPVLLLVALGYLGFRMWTAHAPANHAGRGI